MHKNTWLITGGCGFIGSCVIRHLINNTDDEVINIDKLTYAANLQALLAVESNPRYHFYQIDIADHKAITQVLNRHNITTVMHLAAESHVDNSIEAPSDFIQTNIVGTYNLLSACKEYFDSLPVARKALFRFHQVSTDEVYGDLTPDEPAFTEQHPYKPSSPYSASKASADHLVSAWHRTYKLPVVISNCSNNYGPYQNKEKLIPHTIYNALHHKPLPIYGDGLQIRDWLYVTDHVEGLIAVATNGQVGHTYNIGGSNEVKNIEVVHKICDILQELAPQESSYRDLISFVTDRKGHDRRYAVNHNKITQELRWKPQENFDSGLQKTVEWYMNE